MPALFKGLRLIDIAVVPVPVLLTDYPLADEIIGLRGAVESAQGAGGVSAAEAATWVGHLEEAIKTGRFFSAIIGFCVVGRKP